MEKEKKVFWVSPPGPHPNPLPKGEGVYLQNLGELVNAAEKKRSGAIMRLALLKTGLHG